MATGIDGWISATGGGLLVTGAGIGVGRTSGLTIGSIALTGSGGRTAGVWTIGLGTGFATGVGTITTGLGLGLISGAGAITTGLGNMTGTGFGAGIGAGMLTGSGAGVFEGMGIGVGSIAT